MKWDVVSRHKIKRDLDRSVAGRLWNCTLKKQRGWGSRLTDWERWVEIRERRREVGGWLREQIGVWRRKGGKKRRRDGNKRNKGGWNLREYDWEEKGNEWNMAEWESGTKQDKQEGREMKSRRSVGVSEVQCIRCISVWLLITASGLKTIASKYSATVKTHKRSPCSKQSVLTDYKRPLYGEPPENNQLQVMSCSSRKI